MKTDNSENVFPNPDLVRNFVDSLRKPMDPDDPEATGPWARALLTDAQKTRASDIHFDPDVDSIRIRFRIDGAVCPVATLASEPGLRLLRYFKVNSDLDPAPSRLPEDSHFRIELEGVPLHIRLACAPCVFGDKLAMRILQRSPVTRRFEDLGFLENEQKRIRRWLDETTGMFLVTGPVGSGKTTTLYSLLGELDLNERNIVTIEDPVEYQLPRINQMEVDAKRGLTFEKGLRSILRLDPDYILLGEIRDRESALIAMQAAGAGRVVLSTMHSRTAAGAITMLRSFGVPDQELAASLTVIVSQRLVRRLCTHCRTEEAPTAVERRWLESMDGKMPKRVWHAQGCDECGQSGYHGRTGTFEVAPVDDTTYHLIATGAEERTLQKHLSESEIHSFLEDGLEKAAEGITSLAELTRLGALRFSQP